MLLLAPLGAAAASAAPAGEDAEVRKALDGIPAELLPYVRVMPSATPAPVGLEDALACATRLADAMDGDDDLRDSVLHQCGTTALTRGSPATAEELAGMMRGYRAALLLVEVAERLATTVEGLERARALLTKAGGMLPLMKPWQAQQVLARLLVAGRSTGAPETALAGWWERLTDKEARVEVAVRVLAHRAEETGAFDRSLFQQELGRLSPGQPVPGMQDAAEDLLGQALRHFQTKDEARQKQAADLVKAALEVLKASHTLHAELLVRWAANYVKAGREEVARQLFEQAERSLGAPHEEVARLYYHVARLWNLRGRGQVIRPRLERVEQEVSTMEQVYLPFACAWLSAAWEEAGDAPRATTLMARAVEAAARNENPRMRLAGAAAICLSLAQTGRALPEAAAALAAELMGTTVAAGTAPAATQSAQ